LDNQTKLTLEKLPEEELEAVLANKMAQLAVIQTRYSEALQENRLREEKIRILQEKLDKLITEKEATTESHLQTKQVLKEKMEQFEKLHREEEIAHNNTKISAQTRERELEANIGEMTKALATTQRSMEEKNRELMRLQTQHKEVSDTNKNLKQELSDYKLRATKVLQEKEKTIKELTSQISNSSSSTAHEVNLAEFITVQQERDSLKEEREDLKLNIEQLRHTLQETQNQVESEIELLHNQIKDTESTLEREQKRVQSLQMDLLLKTQELSSLKDDYEKKESKI